jgi:hypothetical protein
MPATSGYQWKHLFLPNGTLLRTIFNDRKIISPSGFANAVGGVQRNAWKAIPALPAYLFAEQRANEKGTRSLNLVPHIRGAPCRTTLGTGSFLFRYRKGTKLPELTV